MSTRKKQPARGWLAWLTIQDAPPSGNEYFTDEEIKKMLQESLDIFSGIRVTRLRIQPLPRAEKSRKISVKPDKSGT